MKTADQKTAKIYAFPVRPSQRQAGGQTPDLAGSPPSEASSQVYATTEFGSCWYHDAEMAGEKDHKQ